MKRNAFIDVAGLKGGDQYEPVIDQTIRDCVALVVVIGPRWLDARDPNGNRRLCDEDDRHRREIEEGIKSGVALIPVLVEGATMPTRDELPPSLKTLAETHALRIDPDRLADDVKPIVQRIKDVQRAAQTDPIEENSLQWLMRGAGGSFSTGLGALLFAWIFLDREIATIDDPNAQNPLWLMATGFGVLLMVGGVLLAAIAGVLWLRERWVEKQVETRPRGMV